MKILVAEDDPVSARVLEIMLAKAGYTVTVTRDGQAALEALKHQSFDALLTDWMMPKMDGIELIRTVRAKITPVPLIVIITALSSPEARTHALSAGADDYFGKPVRPGEVITRLGAGLARHGQPAVNIKRVSAPTTRSAATTAPFVGVFIAASTGGPPAVSAFLSEIPPTDSAAFFVVQHGPAWMLESFTEQLRRVTTMSVHLAEHGMATRPGEIYLAPGDHNMLVDPRTFRLRVVDTPAENFVRPAADPLFRSAAESFGSRSIAVVLTGMGRDGASGAAAIEHAGGTVLIQDPETAVASSMPQSIANLKIAFEQLAPALLPAAVMRHVLRLAPVAALNR